MKKTRSPKRYSKLNENRSKMEPQSEPEIVNISKILEKRNPKNDMKKRCRTEPPQTRFDLNLGRLGRNFGLAEGGGFSFDSRF